MKQQNLEKATALRRRLHKHPEPSMNETWTKSYLMEYLAEHTDLEIHDRGRWFYAAYRKPGAEESIAFRADFDGILMEESLEIPHASQNPGVAHKCGHDGHSAALVGLALEVDQLGADKNVFFLFQHAEETGDGARECVSMIRDEKIDEIFAFHNRSGFARNSVHVVDGISNYASMGMIIDMKGTPTHASQPEYGKNPAYAIARVINGLPVAEERAKKRGLVMATVIQVDLGERAFGIAASEGSLLLTLRGAYEEDLNRLVENVQSLAQREGDNDDLEVSVTFCDVFPETRNHRESVEKVLQAAAAKDLEIIEEEDGLRGSEDFGYYLKETKGALIYIGNGTDHPQVHTRDYDFPDEIIETAVELFKGLIEA